MARAGFGRLRVSPLAVAVAAAPLAAAAFRSPLMVRQQFAAFRLGHAVVGPVLLRGACRGLSPVYAAAVSAPLRLSSARGSRCLTRLSRVGAARHGRLELLIGLALGLRPREAGVGDEACGGREWGQGRS